MALDKEKRNHWIEAICNLAKKSTEHNNLFERYTHSGTILSEDVYLYQGIINFEVIRLNVNALLKQSDAPMNDSGAIALKLLKTGDELEGVKKYKQQHKMVDLLSRLRLKLSAKDKLTIINLLEFKYNTPEYQNLYNQLGKFKLKETPQDFMDEKKAAVHAFHNLLNSLKRSKNKDSKITKLTSAKAFLESLAQNRDFLQDATYEEKIKKENKNKKEETGKVLTISSADKAEMLKFMQESKLEFSEKCMDFFAEKSTPININAYLKSVLNKLSFYQNKIKPLIPPYSDEHLARCQKNLDARKNISSQNFERINTLSKQQELVFDDTVKLYATYLCNHASLMHEDDNIAPDILKSLIDKNIQTQNTKIKTESIFPDTEAEIKDNKDLVLQVAEIYAKSFTSSEPEAEEFNHNFHKQMTDMFVQIAIEQKYNAKDVQKLCNTLKSNPDIEMQRMANNIFIRCTPGNGGKPGNPLLR